jgi:protoheme IX farnesyltransferase
MKPTTASLPLTQDRTSPVALKARFSAYTELTKPRLSSMSAMTAVLGYFASVTAWDGPLLIALVVGSSLSAGGAAALNMWLERDLDGLMERTRQRPLPRRAIPPLEAALTGAILSIAGTALLWVGCGPLAGLLSALTVLCYAGVYTPMKRHHQLSTEVGAVAGALPPLIGWAASGSDDLWLGGWLFALLFLWQMPHFMSISWLYREDYGRADFKMLAVNDSAGNRVAKVALAYAVALCVLTPLPAFVGWTSWGYATVALALGIWQLCACLRFYNPQTRKAGGRALFLRSVACLPLWLLLFTLDRAFL